MPQAEPSPLWLHASENALSRAVLDIARQAGYPLRRTGAAPKEAHLAFAAEHPQAIALTRPITAERLLLALQQLQQDRERVLTLPGGETLRLHPPGVSHQGREEDLTTREAELLQTLLTQPEGGYREELLRHLWGYAAEVETKTLETHLYRLRKKLKQLGGGTEVALEGGRLFLRLGEI